MTGTALHCRYLISQKTASCAHLANDIMFMVQLQYSWNPVCFLLTTNKTHDYGHIESSTTISMSC